MRGHIGERLDWSPSCFLSIPTKFGRDTKRKQNIWSTSQAEEERRTRQTCFFQTTQGPRSRDGNI